MICLECIPLLNAYENYPLEFKPSEFNECKLNNITTVFVCECCEGSIDFQDYYISNDKDLVRVNLWLAEELAEQLSKYIDSCEKCGHGLDMFELKASLYSFYKKEPEDPIEIFNDFNRSTTIGDLITSKSLVDDDYVEVVMKFMRCKCGNGERGYNKDTMYNEDFDFDSEIYMKSDVEQFHTDFYGEQFHEANNIIKLMDREYTIEQLEHFRDSYIENPYFIARNPLFVELEDVLTELWSSGYNFELYSSKRVNRIQKTKKGVSINADRLWNAPAYVSSQGRYNVAGQSILYTAINFEVLRSEVPLEGDDETYHYATFKLNHPLQCLPINAIFSDFDYFINDDSEPKLNENNKKKYIFTNIIQSICMRIGYNGIVYKSVKKPLYINYALFNFTRDKDISMIGYN